MQPEQRKWNAEDYAKNSSAQYQWARELITKLALRGNESVLDIGCGDGKITAQLALAIPNGKVLGIDLSEDMIQLASKIYPSVQYPNLSFIRMDATRICLAEQFDIAFSNAALHWIADHQAVLMGVRNCLKPGGRILFQMGGHGNAAEIFAIVENIMQKPRWRSYFNGFVSAHHFYGPEEYEAWIVESHFKPVRIELAAKDMQHSVEGLTSWLRTTWFPYTDCLPSELRNDFLEEAVRAYVAEHPVDENGNTHVKMSRLEVEALAF
jgi:trans-aconitate 2-methyltransferase